MVFKPKGKPTAKVTNKGKAAYTPTVKDGFNNFIMSSIGLPRKAIWDKALVDVDALGEFLTGKERGEVSLGMVIQRALNVTSDDVVQEALEALFPEGTEKNYEYLLNRFKDSTPKIPDAYESMRAGNEAFLEFLS